MPSMQAPDRPRRPIRRISGRGIFRASPRTTSQVPSGVLSSTNTASQAMPASTASSRRYSTVTLSRSLKVGTTTDNSGRRRSRLWGGIGARSDRFIHDGSVYPPRPVLPRRTCVLIQELVLARKTCTCQACAGNREFLLGGSGPRKGRQKMPTTPERRTARTSGAACAIPRSFQRRSFFSLNVAVKRAR